MRNLNNPPLSREPTAKTSMTPQGCITQISIAEHLQVSGNRVQGQLFNIINRRHDISYLILMQIFDFLTRFFQKCSLVLHYLFPDSTRRGDAEAGHNNLIQVALVFIPFS